jgi:flavin reductase (DIM6/NTAB) family NADH-FMN oxidoreductase RutF
MILEPISLEAFSALPLHIFDKQWMALCAGSFPEGRFNAMTISWGSLGTLWNRPFAQVVVRPVRHTFHFLENYETFTLSVFPEEKRTALRLLGARSGRDGDKIREAGLTPVESAVVQAPSFAEAELVLECRKIYSNDILPQNFLDADIEQNYPNKDYHRAYFGQILAIRGTAAYCKK